MMEAELDEHLGYEDYERSDNPDYRKVAEQIPQRHETQGWKLGRHLADV